MKSVLVGITGGMGAGKSAVAALYARMGYPVFSADTLAREVVAPGADALVEIQQIFGEGAVLDDGSLNRAWVRTRISEDESLRTQLEAITHPRIQARFRELVAGASEAGAKIIFYEAPLLFEANSETNLDAVITVHAPLEVRVARVLARDGGDRTVIENLIASQMPQEEKMSRADYLIENNGSETELKNTAFAVLKEVRKLIGRKPTRAPIPKLWYAGVVSGTLVALVIFWALMNWVGGPAELTATGENPGRVRAREILRAARANVMRAGTGSGVSGGGGADGGTSAASAAGLPSGAGLTEDPAVAFAGISGAVPSKTLRAEAEAEAASMAKEQEPDLAEISPETAPETPTGLRYIFALQGSCEKDGNLIYYPPLEADLAADLKGALPAMRQSLDSLTLPCKPAGSGFNIFAAGMESPDAALDILGIGEDGEVRVIQDGFAAE